MRKSFITLRRGSYLTRLMALLLLILTAAPQVNAQVPSKTAQQHQMQLYQDAVKFDVKKFDRPEQGVIFISYLCNDGRFAVKTASENGLFLIRMNAQKERLKVESLIKDLYYEAVNRFSGMDKETLGDAFTNATSSMPEALLNHAMSPFMNNTRFQNETLAGAFPICTGNSYEFAGGLDNYAEQGPSYGCLHAQPGPAWYYFKIKKAGSLTIKMNSTPGEYDIDFCCWGPFDAKETDPTKLTNEKIVDCSYSGSSVEECYIENAGKDEYYMLLITNFSRKATNIYFAAKEGSTAETECDIVQEYTINVVSSNETYGTVTGGGTGAMGGLLTLSGTALKPNYHVEKWTEAGQDEVISRDNPWKYVIDDDHTFVAHFSDNYYVETTSVNTVEGCSFTGGGTYKYGNTANIKATTKAGYYVTIEKWDGLRWSVIDTGKDYNKTLEVDNNYIYRATFNEGYVVKVICDQKYSYGGEYDLVYNDGDYVSKVSSQTSISYIVELGEDVYLYVDDDYIGEGCHFTNWTDVNGNEITKDYYLDEFEMTKDTIFYANFYADLCTVTVTTNNPYGSVTGAGQYYCGDPVTLTASPASAFIGWSIPMYYPMIIEYGNPLSLPAQEITIIAVFKNYVSVGIEANPSHGGTVAMKDAVGNPIVGEAREEIEPGSTITIEATASEGYAFAGWYDKNTDNIFSKTQKVTFEAMSDMELEARFTDQVIWVRVKKGN